MRELSHLAGVTIGGAAIILTVGGFTLTPAASGHGTVRPQAAVREWDQQARAARQAGVARQARAVRLAPGRPMAAHRAGLRPGNPMVRAQGQPSAATLLGSNVPEITSTNWAGFAATRPGQPFRYIQATFFVPYVNCATTPDSFSAHWAGLDGFDNGTVEQTGVEADCQGGKASYAAWWEMFPNFAIFPNIVVHPGDSIVASVFYRRSTRMFELSLTDTSDGQRFTRVSPCPPGSVCQRSSAEAISEPPANGAGTILPLSDFSAESFSGVRVTDQAGNRGTLRSSRWSTLRIVTKSAADGAILDQPTQLFQGMTFANYWMRSS